MKKVGESPFGNLGRGVELNCAGGGRWRSKSEAESERDEVKRLREEEKDRHCRSSGREACAPR